MARLNTATVTPQVSSPVRTESRPSTLTALGAPGYLRDAHSALFILGVSLYAGEKAFHDTAKARDSRFVGLVRQLAVADPAWTARFLGWLRAEAGIRTASLIGGAEFVAARKEAGIADDDHIRRERGLGRRVIDSVCQRADEPAEILAYWLGTYGRRIPKAIDHGLGDAARRLWNERSLLKWDSAERAVRFADVLQLAHAAPQSEWQSSVYKHALDRRYGNTEGELADNVMVLRYRRELMAVPVEARRDFMRNAVAKGTFAEQLRHAGMTWESVAGWLQAPMDAAAWEAVLPTMGVQALLRNLRNFDRAKLSDAFAAIAGTKIASETDVRAARVYPYRFVAALRAAPSYRWHWPLEQGLAHSLTHIPALDGHTLVLVDRSPSMWHRTMSEHSEMSWADGAAIFGAALALRAEHADLVEFGNDNDRISFDRSESVLRLIGRFTRRNGTDIPTAIRQHYERGQHTRVVIVTDEQTRPGCVPYWAQQGFFRQPEYVDLDRLVDPACPVYIWNFGGYEAGFMPTGTRNRHCFGGLTDNAFKIVPLLERGANADWPF